MSPTHIRVHIDELVLEGFEPGTSTYGAVVRATVEAELGRLLAAGAREGWAPGPNRDVVDGGQITAPSRARPEAIGAQVARAVYKRLR